MRLCFLLLFCTYLMGCAKPIQMELPKDHPANPLASEAPERGRSDFWYHLPHHNDKAGESGLPGTGNTAAHQHKTDEKTGHAGHGSLSPKKAEGDHDH